MAKLPSLPTEEGLGARPVPSPNLGVATMDMPANNRSAQYLSMAGEGASAAADYLYKAQVEHAGMLADDAVLKLKDAISKNEHDPDTGWRNTTLQPATTPEFFKKHNDLMTDKASEIAASISDPMARQLFERKSKSDLLMNRARLLDHQSQQGIKWRVEQATTATELARQELSMTPLNSPLFANTYNAQVEAAASAVGKAIQNSVVPGTKEGDAQIVSAMRGVREQFAMDLIKRAINEKTPEIAQQMYEGTYPGMPALKDHLGPKAQESIGPLLNHAVSERKTAVLSQSEVNTRIGKIQSDQEQKKLHVDAGVPQYSTRDQIIGDLIKREGGYVAIDGASGAPAKYGINGRSHPDVDVASLTQDQAAAIYKKEYWDKIGGDALLMKNPKLALVAMDTAANFGVTAAQQMLKQAGGDVGKLLDIREARYRTIADVPAQRGNLRGWLNRNDTLRQTISSPTAPLMEDTGMRDYAATKEDFLTNLDRIAKENNLTPEEKDAFRNKTLQGLSQWAEAQNALRAQALSKLSAMAVSGNYTDISQMKADPQAAQWFKGLDAQSYYHLSNIISNRGNAVHQTNPVAYRELLMDVLDGKVTDDRSLVLRLGTGQVGIQHQETMHRMMKLRESGADVIDKDMHRMIKIMAVEFASDPTVSALGAAGKEMSAKALEDWHQAVVRRIDEINKLDVEPRRKALLALFDNSSPDYVGPRSAFSKAFVPTQEQVTQKKQETLDEKIRGGMLGPARAGQMYDEDRRIAFQNEGIIMLPRNQEQADLLFDTLLPGMKVAGFYPSPTDPNVGIWVVNTKKGPRK